MQDLEPTLKKWGDTISVNVSSIEPADQISTPVPQLTPLPTPMPDNNSDGFADDLDGEDSSDEA